MLKNRAPNLVRGSSFLPRLESADFTFYFILLPLVINVVRLKRSRQANFLNFYLPSSRRYSMYAIANEGFYITAPIGQLV
jgi:hypothetical protein